MLVDLGARLATQYRIKIGGLEAKKRLIKGRPQDSQEDKDYWQMGEKWDHFKICLNERGQDNNFKLATDIMKHYAKKDEEPADARPREINIILFSNNMRDIYDDFRAFYRGRSKCQCRTDTEVHVLEDGRKANIAHWNIALGKVPDQANLKIIRQDRKYAHIVCPGDACPFVMSDPPQCKINLIFNCMIKESPEIGGAATFRATSFNSAIDLRGSLLLLHQLTRGHIAGVPLKLKLKTGHGEKGPFWSVYLSFPGDPLAFKKKALAYSKASTDYDQTLVKLIGASTMAESESEEEIKGVMDEFYPDTVLAEAEEVDVVKVALPSEEEVEETLDQTAEEVAEKEKGSIDDIWEGEEEEKAPTEETTEPETPKKEPEPKQQALGNLF